MRWVAAVLVIVVTAAACGGDPPPTAAGSRMEEPTFGGQPARRILRQLQDSSLARDSVPTHLLMNPDGLRVLRWLLEQGDLEVAVSASRALARRGTMARVAIPQLALLAETSPPPDRREFLVAVGAISDGSREELDSIVKALAATDVELLHDALGASDKLAWDGGALVEDVARLLDHADPSIRAEAARVLSYSGAHAERAVAELAKGVPQDYASVVALGRFGAAARSVAPAVAEQLGAERGWAMVRLAGLIGDDSLRPGIARWKETRPFDTATALARLGDRSDELRIALEPVLADGSGDRNAHHVIRAAAGLYLVEGPDRIVPALLGVLDDRPAEAALELGAIGQPAAAAIPALKLLSVDPRRMGHREARWALRRIGGQ